MSSEPPPTELVDVFNNEFFLGIISEKLREELNANFLRFPNAQGDERLNRATIAFPPPNGDNSDQVPTTAWVLANAGGGGGGNVFNPMTTDLDANGFTITNLNRINTTEAPELYDYGAITPQQYAFMKIPNQTAGAGTVMISLRALVSGLSHQLVLQVIGYTDRSVIRIINNCSESDTLVFTNIAYGQDPTDPNVNLLCFTAGVASTNCEYSYYQNGNDLYALTSNWEPITVNTPTTLVLTHAEKDITLNTAGTSGNWNTSGSSTASSTITDALSVNTITELTPTNDIRLLNTLNLSNGNIKQVNQISTDNIGVNAGSEITALNSINLNGNDLQNTNNLYTNNIFENTPGNNIVVHDVLNMSNNHIHNLQTPTQNNDAANKAYVDTAVAGFISNPLTTNINGANTFTGINFINPTNAQDVATKNYVDTTAGSGVQNPMTSNLDCGTFSIDNCSGVTATQLNTIDGGFISSRGSFIHGGSLATIGPFNVGGDTITFAPNTSVSFKNFGTSTTYFEYEQSTQSFNTENGGTQNIRAGGKIILESGSELVLENTLTTSTTVNQFNSLNQQNLDHYPMFNGSIAGTPNLPMVIAPSFQLPVLTKDVTSYLPFNSATGWDNSSDGGTIIIPDANNLVNAMGLPKGVNNNDNYNFPLEGWLVSFGLSNPSQLGGWVCSGGARLEVVYSNFSGGVYQSFVPPIFIASLGNAFNNEVVNIATIFH